MSSHSRNMIAVSEKTYKNLAQMGTLEDTFDSVIDRMIQKIAVSGTSLAGKNQTSAITPQSTVGAERDK
jgi:hypothetical protein